MNILLLEDQDDQIDLFKDNIEALEEDNGISICLTATKNITEFKKYLLEDIQYDAMIIDLKLGSHTTEYEGNEAFRLALEHAKCILYIYSATIEHTDDSLITKYSESPFIKKYGREQLTIKELLIKTYEIYDTGITQYLTSRDSMDKLLRDLFWNETKELVKYLQDKKPINSAEIIKNYLGIALESKIIESLNEDKVTLTGELLYLSPRIREKVNTGSILKFKDELFFVITPACDIAQHKTNFLTLIKIIDEEKYLRDIDMKNAVARQKGLKGSEIFKDNSLTKSGKGLVDSINSNPKGISPYYALPKGIFITNNMILDFYQITTIHYSEKYEVICHLHNRITKDIVSQFSSHFNRQGSPNYTYEFEYKA